MTCYYSRGMRVVPTWLFALAILGPAIWACFTSDGITLKVMGIVFLGLLAVMAWFTYWHISRPIIEVAGDRVAVRGLLRPQRELDDLENYKLVISNDYLAFRPSDGQDITIDRGDFSKRKWQELIKDLRSLPITEYEGI
ncbi:hypothetical protein PC39_11242 [Salinisphaera sp. PC39]